MSSNVTIAVFADEKTLTLDEHNQVTVKISKAPNNGISIGEDGKLHLKKGNSEMDEESLKGKTNTPGNGIAGTYGKTITRVQCNETVTRVLKRPDDRMAVMDVATLVNGILGNLSSGEEEEGT